MVHPEGHDLSVVHPEGRDLSVSVSQWYTLKDVKSGRVHLVLEWVPTVSTAARLHQVSAYTIKLIVSYLIVHINGTAAPSG